MKKTCTISAIFILVLAFWTVAWAAGQQEIKSAAGGFSVKAPVVLGESVQSKDYPELGKVEMHAFLGQQDNVSYGVIYNDLSEALVRNPQERLDKVRDGAVKNLNGKLMLEQRITLEGYPGRELVIDFVPQPGKAAMLKERIFLVKNRLYQVKCIAFKDKVNMSEIDGFLQSFKLLKK